MIRGPEGVPGECAENLVSHPSLNVDSLVGSLKRVQHLGISRIGKRMIGNEEVLGISRISEGRAVPAGEV